MARILYSLCGADQTRPFSPHCWKVVMALTHKQLDFQEVPSPFTAIPSLENGFSKTVPILNDNGHLIRDSFDIAVYLEETYPDRPSLFGGEGGQAAARLIEGYSQSIVHPAITRIAVKDIHDMLDDPDRRYFRRTREAALDQTLETVADRRDTAIADFPAKLQPLRHMLKFQPYVGGETPLFGDYILFGALQWARITTGLSLLPADDPVSDWFERCLDLHGQAGRTVTVA